MEVTCGSEITYTFVIQNTGNTPAVATDNVVITDTFNPALSDISAAYNGTPFTNYAYNEATGEFETNIGAITVPAATFTQAPVTGKWTIQQLQLQNLCKVKNLL